MQDSQSEATRYILEVRPVIPQALERLNELANDLLYSWDRQVRSLFGRLDYKLWTESGHNPKLFLRRVSQERLLEAVDDRMFMEDFNRAVSVYDIYQQQQIRPEIKKLLNPKKDLIAYFCAEFGFHESLPIYSGGLGILAGDHCKAASDLGIPFIAVGMMYRQGYFIQSIDEHGNQIAHYAPTSFKDLPIEPACNSLGEEIQICVPMADRSVTVKVWQARAGHICLYLLDTDLPDNSAADRAITYQLYGGDNNTRIQQEIVLGIGGVRALGALGLNPTVWHINEGHAAFQILERCRNRIEQDGLTFSSALELVCAGTVFTTHTPVAAGHDIFDHDLMRNYFSNYLSELNINMDQFLSLGASPVNQNGFNQTALALRGSGFHNGVSRVHGGVASNMESYVWPQIPDQENPISYVTNGVHVPTFLAQEWANLYDMRFGREWRYQLLNESYWERIEDIPNHSFWSMRQTLKSELLEEARKRVILQQRRNGASEAHIERLTQYLTPHETDVLTLGFARRFATYKRATLLFSNPERLSKILNNEQHPVLLIFAGKAHPNDMPGQHLIRLIHDFSQRPEFLGKIILLEGYDLALARRLVTGVDVWLNTPESPLEASGTSGQKAGINGVINLSVADGWWAEGCNGVNGWTITPHGPKFEPSYRNQQEANELLDILEYQVVPLYYQRNGHGFSEGWVHRSKASMKSILPQYNAQRMVMDYIQGYYAPAILQRKKLAQNEFEGAKELSSWKEKIRRVWSDVKIRRVDDVQTSIQAGHHLRIVVACQLNDLQADDLMVECIIGTVDNNQCFQTNACFPLNPMGKVIKDETIFELEMEPPLPGQQFYHIRAYPHHRLLSHPFEMGSMIWL